VRQLFIGERCIGRVRGDVNYQRSVGGDYFSFDELTWDPIIALRLLTGESVPNVAGIFLIDGKHKPVWSSEPGVVSPKFRVG
jgi:hypothetical protein